MHGSRSAVCQRISFKYNYSIWDTEDGDHLLEYVQLGKRTLGNIPLKTTFLNNSICNGRLVHSQSYIVILQRIN